MDDPPPIPKMLRYLFGDAAAAAQGAASPRLLLWCQAFEDWLAERHQKYQSGAYELAERSWRRLLSQQGRLPWELAPAHIAAHFAWMRSQGLSSSYIKDTRRPLVDFYRWCAARGVDPECPPSFNPPAAVPPPPRSPYAGQPLLSQAEVDRLFGLLQRDLSPLGRREYAFFLARLRLGVPLLSLQRLRWDQLEQITDRLAWVRWRPEAQPVPLPGDVWQAIREWLAASGRLPGIAPGDYIFTPLVDPTQTHPIDRPQAWASGRCLTRKRVHCNLKLYGRQAGLPGHKLTCRVLRLTALRLRLQAGATPAEMHPFLDSRCRPSHTSYLLSLLPPLPPDPPASPQPPELPAQPALPARKAALLQPADLFKHGFYARSRPPEQVQAILSENIHGIEDEIAGLRGLARGLLEMQLQASTSQDAARLAQAYTLTATRLAAMVEAEKHLSSESEKDNGTEEFLDRLDRMWEEMGREPLGSAIRAEALANEPALAANSRRLEEEIASVRLVLRNTLALAGDAGQQPAAGEYVHLVDVYSQGCNRLVRLLRTSRAAQDWLTVYVQQLVDDVLREVQKDWPQY
jgi:hypothetical protein